MPTALTSKKSTPPSETWGAWRQALRLDPFILARFLYRALPAESNHLSPAFHGRLCQWEQTTPYDENLYLVSRGHFKTTLLSVVKNIQRILADPDDPACRLRWRGHPCGPDTRILIASNKGENAEDILKPIKAHLENEHLIALFPEILVADPEKRAAEWTKTAITVKRKRRDLKESTIQTIGVTGELTSKHYDHGCFDDIVGKENSGTKDEREKVWDFLIKSRPLFDPGSTRDYIGTHWHYDDAYARLKEQRRLGEIKLGVYQMPAWLPCPAGDPDGANVPSFGWVKPTFGERFCMEPSGDEDRRLSLLAERRRGTSNFAAQYLLDPVSSDTAHFELDKLNIETAHPPIEDLWVLMTVDPAISVKSHADFSGLAVGGFDLRGDLWILELLRIKRDDVTLIREVFALYQRYPMIRSIGFEAVGFASTYRVLFDGEGRRRGYFLPILTLPRTTKITKNVRIGGLQGPWNSGQIHILRSCKAFEEFRDEASKFRPDQEAAHDDLLDAVGDLYEYRRTPYQRPATPFTDDPVLAERIAHEQEMQRTRTEQGLPPLDAASLRVAYRMQQHEPKESPSMSTAWGWG